MEKTEVDLIILEARVKGIEYKRLAATPRLTTAHLLEYNQSWSSVVTLMRTCSECHIVSKCNAIFFLKYLLYIRRIKFYAIKRLHLKLNLQLKIWIK